MKQLAILLGILGLSGLLYAATITQPMPSPISVLTPTQVLASTPTYAGQVIVCNGCTSGNTLNPYSLCVATTAANGSNAYILISSAAAVTACK